MAADGRRRKIRSWPKEEDTGRIGRKLVREGRHEGRPGREEIRKVRIKEKLIRELAKEGNTRKIRNWTEEEERI